MCSSRGGHHHAARAVTGRGHQSAFGTWWWRAALLCGGVAVLLSCEGEPAGPAGSSLVIENRSTAWGITGVYLAETNGTSGWGLDQLTSDIDPNESYTIEVEPDTYDIRIEADHPASPLMEFGYEIAESEIIFVTVTDQDIEITRARATKRLAMTAGLAAVFD